MDGLYMDFFEFFSTIRIIRIQFGEEKYFQKLISGFVLIFFQIYEI